MFSDNDIFLRRPQAHVCTPECVHRQAAGAVRLLVSGPLGKISMTETCPHCGTENPAGYDRCSKCGIHVLTPKNPIHREPKVRLGHGPHVTKSTADRIRKQNELPTRIIMIFAVLMFVLCVCSLISDL